MDCRERPIAWRVGFVARTSARSNMAIHRREPRGPYRREPMGLRPHPGAAGEIQGKRRNRPMASSRRSLLDRSTHYGWSRGYIAQIFERFGIHDLHRLFRQGC